MILNNLKNIIKTYALLGNGCAYDGTKSYIDAPYPIFNTSGVEQTYVGVGNYSGAINTFPFMIDYMGLATSYPNSSTGYTYLILGNGSTQVTENDYAMESIITTNISLHSSTINRSIEKDANSDKLTKNIILTYLVKNTGSSDLTVSEAGLLYGYYTKENTKATALIHREVFDNPVVIPAGGVRNFRFEFEFVNQLV